jgi:hypothetical protein
MWNLTSTSCRLDQNGKMYLIAYWSCNKILGATNLLFAEQESLKTINSEQIISLVKEILGSEEVSKIEQEE